VSRRISLVLVLATAGLGLPAAAPAQEPAPPSAESEQPASGADASAKRKRAQVKIVVGGLDDGRALINTRVPVSGTLRPFRAGERVELQFFHDGELTTTRPLKVRRGSGNFGVFSSRYFLREDVHYAVRAVHLRSSKLGKDSTVLKDWGVWFPNPGYGECGKYIKLFKSSLKELGFVPGGGPCWGARTSRAVLAYRKTNNMSRNYHAGPRLFRDAFNGEGAYHVKHTTYGKHVEIDISRQILVLINAAGEPALIYPVSTGTSSTPTVRGHFDAYGYRNPGYNSHGMLWSVYFYGGYAIHGYASVPNYPASHGCVRTPIPDAHRIYKWINDGDDIFVDY
jgi:L,D-transpeptidase-like protein